MNRLLLTYNYRPLTVIGILTAIHTLAYGVGYIIPTSGFARTVLYESIGLTLNPGYVGVLLLVMGLYSLYSWVIDDGLQIALSSAIMAFFWLFAAMSYFVVGAFGLGVGVGFVWSLLSGYIAFAYKNKEETVTYLTDKHFRDILNGKIED